MAMLSTFHSVYINTGTVEKNVINSDLSTFHSVYINTVSYMKRLFTSVTSTFHSVYINTGILTEIEFLTD